MTFRRPFLIFLLLIPLLSLPAYEGEGTASWYGPNFQGKKTANGEIFDTNKLTAAHRTLPFDTMVRVTNLNNGQTVTVRINDRGPYVGDRIIDLSREAAAAIDMIESGTAPVKLETVDPAVEAISYTGPVTCTIQVASYSNLINALNMKRKLSDAGYSPAARLSNAGLTRLFLDNIPVEDCYGIVKDLESRGITGLVIRQDR